MRASKPVFVCAMLLIAVGLIAAAVAFTMVDKWWYAAIPAKVGILLGGCGWLAGRWPRLHFLAPIVAIIGIVGSFMPSGLNFSSPGSVAFVSSIFRVLTILICAVYVVLWIRGLTQKRRSE